MPSIRLNDTANQSQPEQTLWIIGPSLVFTPTMDPVRHSQYKCPHESIQPHDNIPQTTIHSTILNHLIMYANSPGKPLKGREKGGTIGGIERGVERKG